MILLVVALRVSTISVLFIAMRSRAMIRSVLCRSPISAGIAMVDLRRRMVDMRIPAGNAFRPVPTRILLRPIIASIVYVRVIASADVGRS